MPNVLCPAIDSIAHFHDVDIATVQLTLAEGVDE